MSEAIAVLGEGMQRQMDDLREQHETQIMQRHATYQTEIEALRDRYARRL